MPYHGRKEGCGINHYKKELWINQNALENRERLSIRLSPFILLIYVC
jgi:hypothetical protein